MYTRILVATDGSDLSQKAVESALALASSLKAELVALKVVHRYPHSYFEGTTRIDMTEPAKVEAEWTKAAQAAVDAVVATGRARGVATRGQVEHSDAVAETIIAVAKKNHCDLIVMASHGRRGIGRLLLGSETQHVLTHSHTPVLVLR